MEISKDQIDKQAIEEMKQQINIALARDCSKARCLTCEFINEENCEPSIIADALYNAGYRKQSDGEWVKDAPHWRYKCNQCGFFPLMVHGDFLPYCPNCGAKMKGD